MGVTNRNEIIYKTPDTVSSTESLHLPHSGSESSVLNAVEATTTTATTSTNVRRQRNRINLTDAVPVNNPSSGRRKQRRYKSVRELEVLLEEEEPTEFLEDGIPHHSPFVDILTDPAVEKIWTEFTEKDEEAQRRLLEEKPQKYTNKRSNTCITPLVAYQNISPKIRMHFKKMRNFTELERIENEILQFFTNSPKHVYVSDNKSSFQRLLIHGVAQYYGLKSNSVDGENNQRIIRVTNPTDCAIGREYSLITQIEINRKNNK